jgi:hypothetical protein
MLQNNIFEPNIMQELVILLLKDPVLERSPDLDRPFYSILIEKNQLDRVQEIMNTSLEGMDEAGRERVRLKKVAAAEAVIEVDNENVDAVYIIATMSNPDENSPYTLYGTVLNKAKEVVDLGAVLEKKKAQIASQLKDCTVYFNSDAFLLPAVMDAKWEEGFEGINFASFSEQIKVVFQGCRDGLAAKMEKLEDIVDIEAVRKAIKENEALEKEYLEYFGAQDRRTLQSALNSNSRTAVYGNKMKAIARSIQGYIDEGIFMEAMGVLSELKVNMETCSGGDQQAIEMCYMNRMLSKGVEVREEKSMDQAEASLRIEKEKVLNLLYTMRSNWVLENHDTMRNGSSCVAYSPEKVGESFIEHILKAFPKAAEFLGKNTLRKDIFNNTHDGLAIMGIAGKELGLRAKDSHPAFDPNCACSKALIQSPFITKASLLEVFTNAFTFENTWKIIAKELFENLASESKIEEGYELFTDEACTQKLDLSQMKDPFAKGATAFLKNIGFKTTEINEIFSQQECFYKYSPESKFIDSVQLSVGFSKEGLGKILQKLGLLSVA